MLLIVATVVLIWLALGILVVAMCVVAKQGDAAMIVDVDVEPRHLSLVG